MPTIFGTEIYKPLDDSRAGLPLAQEAGVSWIRDRVYWSSIEPADTTPDQYRWSATDNAMNAGADARRNMLITIMDNPQWAATYSNGPIDKVSLGKFTEFVGALVERYDGDGVSDAPGAPVVNYWEFYNEPDNGDALYAEYGASYWGHYGAQYAQMLCTVYPEIKARNPNAQVVLGGLAYDWFDDEMYSDGQPGPFVRAFLDDVLAAGGGQCFDVMNYHYYPSPSFTLNWEQYGKGVSGKANYIRSKLTSYGYPDKPLVLTEAGWPSDEFNSTPEVQARMVVKLFTQALASRHTLMIWWCWQDDPNWSGAWGLVTASLERKVSFNAYKAAAPILGAATYQQALSLSELNNNTDLEGYRFLSGTQRPLYVLWSNYERNGTVKLPLSSAQITDLYGQITGTVNDGDDGKQDGRIQLTVGPNPIYVEAGP